MLVSEMHEFYFKIYSTKTMYFSNEKSFQSVKFMSEAMIIVQFQQESVIAENKPPECGGENR